MNIFNDDTQNYPFCRLQLVAKMFRHPPYLTNQIKFDQSPQSYEPTNKKTLLQNFLELVK